MNLPTGLLPPLLQWIMYIASALLLFFVLRRAPWRRLTNPTLLHVWLGTVVTVLALWHVKAGIKPGLDLHLIGASALTLIAGPHLAVVGLSLVLLSTVMLGSASLAGVAFNGIMLVALPVALTQLTVCLSKRYLPQHLFIYLFVTVFFGTAFAMATTAIGVNGLLALAGAYPTRYLYSDYLPYFLLLAWPEALLTGMALTLMVVFRPSWVESFDEARY